MKKQNKQSMTTPLVSVVMPMYNAEAYVTKALDSVMTQTYKNFEVIIVDDASTDKSVAIVQKYQRMYPGKIELVRLKKNRNSGGDRCANEGLKRAKGVYVARMDADDIAVKDRIAKQVAYLETHNDVFLVGSNAYVINQNGEVIGEKTEPSSSKAIYKAYFGFHPLIHPSCTYRRLLKDGQPFMYEIKYSANNDYYTFFKLICAGYNFVNLPENLVYYRIHGKNATFVNIKKKFMNALKIRLDAIKFGYKPSMKDLITLGIQAVVVMGLPENVTYNLYLLSKGIVTPKDIIVKIGQTIAFGFTRFNKFATAQLG